MNPFNVISVLGTLFFIAWLGIALTNAINPYLAWKITDSWRATKEPPQSYFFVRRIGGIVFSAIGFGFFVLVLTMYWKK